MAEKHIIVTESWVRRVEQAMAKLDHITGTGVTNTPHGVSIVPPRPRRSPPPQFPPIGFYVVYSAATKRDMYYAKSMTRRDDTPIDPTSDESGQRRLTDFWIAADEVDSIVWVARVDGQESGSATEWKYTIPLGAIVWGFPLGETATDGKPIIMCDGLMNAIFWVRLVWDGGGADGNATAVASWTYDVYSIQNNVLLVEGVQVNGRRTKGSATKATRGLAVATGSSNFTIVDTDEQVTQNWP